MTDSAENAGQDVAVPVADAPADPTAGLAGEAVRPSKRPREIGGPSGLEPTRYGDWERNGRVSDF
jgi:hypothetical protein